MQNIFLHKFRKYNIINSERQVSLTWQPIPQATDTTKSALFIIYCKKLYKFICETHL